MKKLMMVAAMMLMSIGAFAQEGSMAVGAHLGYAGYGDGYSHLGLGARFQYEFVENIRGEIDGITVRKVNDADLVCRFDCHERSSLYNQLTLEVTFISTSDGVNVRVKPSLPSLLSLAEMIPYLSSPMRCQLH